MGKLRGHGDCYFWVIRAKFRGLVEVDVRMGEMSAEFAGNCGREEKRRKRPEISGG